MELTSDNWCRRWQFFVFLSAK